MPYFITTLCSKGQRLYAGDLMDNVSFLKYREGTNQLVEFADGGIPRSITSMDLLDYNTVVCGDKGGNLFVERIDPKVDDDVANPTGNQMLWTSGFLSAAPNKVWMQGGSDV
jgi:splicing factor 3B subunit 3